MLAAHLMIVQVLDLFEIRCTVTEFMPDVEPVHVSSGPLTVVLPDGWEEEDALSTTMRLIALWSEITNRT